MSGIKESLDYAIKTKRFIGGLGRLKKNGRIAKINGQVFARKVSKNGDEYVIIDNFLGNRRSGGKRWQIILLKNVISINENGWSHVRKSA